MKKLILIRHAKSDWKSPAPTDFDRPLNKRGKKAAPLMGQRLAERHCRPDLLISSPAKRALQTASRIARQLKYPDEKIKHRKEIFEASLKTLVNLVRDLNEDANEIILIGHNPGFSELGQWLSGDAPEWLPTCGLLELELAIEIWAQAGKNCATLRCYDYPKKTL